MVSENTSSGDLYTTLWLKEYGKGMTISVSILDPNSILVPPLRTDIAGFEWLGHLNDKLRSRSAGTNLDFRNTNWIDANMCTPLGAVIKQQMRRGKPVRLLSIKREIENLLHRNGFMTELTGGIRIRDTNGTNIPYRCYTAGMERMFPNHIMRLSHDKKSLDFSEVTRGALMQSVGELFSNSSYHSKTKEGIFVCGQYYPQSQLLRFSIADLGQGIEGSVGRHLMRSLSETESIEWAMRKGNTSRLGGPGGLGLSNLRQFIESNDGSLHVVSGRGVIKYKRAYTEQHVMPLPYPGTCVSFEINTSISTPFLDGSEMEMLDDIF